MRRFSNRLLAAAATLPALLALAVAAGVPVAASEVEGLYRAEVPVASRSREERERALGDALRQVLVKITGIRRPETSPAIGEALASPGRFLQQFRYRAQAESPAPGSAPVETLWLQASFDPRVVDASIRDAGLPVWGSVRPDLLVWLAVERNGARELVGSVDPDGFGATLTGSGAQRGVPVTLPLLDLEDRLALEAGDVWAGAREQILAASARYPSDSVLVGRIYKILPTLWEARWTLFPQEGGDEWAVQGDLVELVISDGVQQAADRLASRFAALAASPAEAGVELVVSDVRTVPDYARVLRYFSDLDTVKRVDVTGVEGDRLRLRLQSQSGGDVLRQTIALGRTLIPDTAPSDSAVLWFRLLP